MLYIKRKIGQEIVINNNVRIKVAGIKGGIVQLAFECKREASILRKELYDRIREENIGAATSSTEGDTLAALGNLKKNGGNNG